MKQIDVDGNYVYSNIASASLIGTLGFSLENMYPNPAANEVSIGVISNVNTSATITMTDMLGRVVMSENWAISVGYNINQFDITKLDVGSYAVTLHGGNIKTSKKLVVER